MKQFTFQDAIHHLNESGIGYRVLDLSQTGKLIICNHGMTLLGPFWGNRESSTWMPRSISLPPSNGSDVSKQAPLFGGDRIGIAFSEERAGQKIAIRQYRNLTNFDRSTVRHVSSSEKGRLVITEKIGLPFCTENVLLSIINSIYSVQNPLSGYSGEPQDLDFVGYGQELMLESPYKGEFEFDVKSSLHMRSGGLVRIPYTHEPDWESFQTSVAEKQIFYKTHADICLDGNRSYQLAYYPTFLIGRIGYIRILSDDEAFLIIRNFPCFSLPRGHSDSTWKCGHDVCLQYHSDPNDSFGTITNEFLLKNDLFTSNRVNLQTWFFRGKASSISKAANLLLCEEK